MSKSQPMERTAATYADLEDAAKRINGIACQTPLLESRLLNERVGGRLLVKAEPLQRTGSFKFRGAYNKISRLTPRQRAQGLVAYSSGNHAQGVAAAAALFGASATIVMPSDAPRIKIANTMAYGAAIEFYDRETDDREAIGERIRNERGAVLIKPYDDPLIIAGQGTVGLELARQARKLHAELDAVLVPCGGGGLIAGIALALAEDMPGVPIHPVEPAGYDDTARSLAIGVRQINDGTGSSICDALLASTPGELTFAINARHLSHGLSVTDDQVQTAMQAAYSHLKLVVEPGGAVALAAALSGAIDCRGKTIAIVCSGGNVDARLFHLVLDREPPAKQPDTQSAAGDGGAGGEPETGEQDTAIDNG